MILLPKRCFSFRSISVLEICSSSYRKRGLEDADVEDPSRNATGVECAATSCKRREL